MKLILAIVSDEDQNRLREALIEAGYSATKLASTGGFIMRGNTTLLIGVAEKNVDHVLEIIKDCCQKRTRYIPSNSEFIVTEPMEVEEGGSTVFVLSVDQFHKT